MFTKEQEDFMRNNYLTMSNKKIAEYFDSPTIYPNKIQYWLSKNKLFRPVSYRTNPVFSQYDIDYIKCNYLNMSYKDIAENLGFKEKQIRCKAEHMGLVKNRKINDHYFDNIDTSLKAYFLGFIFADGYIVESKDRRNHEFGMQLQHGDLYVLEKLNNELGGQNIIYHKEACQKEIVGNMCNCDASDTIRVYSANIVSALTKNGIETNKTQKNICPQVSDEFFFDFLRGYIDGDGCFWKNKNHYYMHITCASEVILNYLQERLMTFNIQTHVYKEVDKKYRLICCNVNNMKKLVNRLYYRDDLFCLKRKYEKVKYYLGFTA